MTISEAKERRQLIEFGAGHMDNYIGNENIWYLFSFNDKNETVLTKELAFKRNPKIEVISWLYPRWR